MNFKKGLFGDFDFSVVDDPNFKEDAVREDIIAPLLRGLGYSSTGQNKIIRSLALEHPEVSFGVSSRRLTIIPDYVLTVGDQKVFVLDAKAPNQNITEGANVYQAFSYAIHPEIRSFSYGLCNGRELALYEISSVKPKRVFDLTKLTDVDLLEIAQKLNPRSIAEKSVLGFCLDAGLYLHAVMDLPLTHELIFPCFPIANIGTVNHNHYTCSAVSNTMADRPLMVSFDFKAQGLQQLLSLLPLEKVAEITRALSMHPYSYRDEKNPPWVHVTSLQTSEPIIAQNGEMFCPFKVVKFSME